MERYRLSGEAAIAAGLLFEFQKEKTVFSTEKVPADRLEEARAGYGTAGDALSRELHEALRLLRAVRQKLRENRTVPRIAAAEENGAAEVVPRITAAEESGAAEVEVGDRLEIRINGREISITPLPKALFLLFLKHPEGIAFKEISDYRGELVELYCRTSGRDSRELCERSVDRLIDPSSNSLDTQRYLLRRQFEAQMEKTEAGKYCILGLRGEKKRVNASLKKSGK